MLLDLPEEEAWRAIALYLGPRDLLRFLTVHPNIHERLSTSASFWGQLLARDRDHYGEEIGASSDGEIAAGADDARRAFMLQSHVASLSSVKWLPLSQEMQQRRFPVKAREGHNSCALDGPDGYKTIVVAGGFSDDVGVTVINLRMGIDSHAGNWGWTRLEPRFSSAPSFVYGASLTPLPSALSREMERDRAMKLTPGITKVNVAKAVRFGGFEGGGYSGEKNGVWVLTIVDLECEDDSDDQFAIWEKMETQGPSPRARAYHSATLIHDRYLVVIGGMTHSGCCMEESILDIKNWTWFDASLACKGEPRGRHGHSVLWDQRRDRLVMFGGGSGTDLLRTGRDNNEVWELKMNGIALPQISVNSRSGSGKKETMWEWSKIHKDTLYGRNNSAGDEDSDSDDSERGRNDAGINLSPSESLCLGRCHNSMKLSPDAVLLLFGGGRPSTNGVLGYDLAKDAFVRPNVRGPLPVPRFTGVACFLETEGYVLVHGGFNDEIRGAVLDMNVLDLAPSLGRNFAGFPVDEDRPSQGSVTDQDAIEGQYGATQQNLGALQRMFLAALYQS